MSIGEFAENGDDFFVAELAKVLVRPSDGDERLRTGKADDEVGDRTQRLNGLTGSHRHSNPPRGRGKTTYGRDRSQHGRAGRQAVINQDHGRISDIKIVRWKYAAAALKFEL